MDLGLQGKSAIVAAASSGLGLAIALELASEGVDVAICARDPERLEDAHEQLEAAGSGHVSSTALDLLESDEIKEWVDSVAEDRGGLHIVVANAGGPPGGPARAHDLAAYRDAVELNLLASIALAQAALPHLLEAEWGRILFVTSQSVRQPIPGLALSNTARPGVLGYAKSLVADLGAAGITVNVLAPGPHRTARLEELAGTGGLAQMAEDIPIGRIGSPEEFAAAAAFLASERASYITGAVLPVDGGSSRGLL